MNLADNPPEYPYADLETSDPLVLYIARVPGNRDVFLTTTKPLQKVVTAQDVQSSLYYIHLDSQDDERLREFAESLNVNPEESSTDQEGRSPNSFMGPAFERPPPEYPCIALQSSPQSSLPALPNPQVFLPESPLLTTIARKPIGEGARPESQAAHSRLMPSGAHPIGPRSMESSLHCPGAPGLRPAQGKENLIPRRWSEQPPISQSSASLKTVALGNTPASRRDPVPSYSNTSRVRSSDQEDNLERQSFHFGTKDVSLTFIRRYGGSQWNVARVFNAKQPGYHAENYAPPQPDDIVIHISTPGYAKYHLPSLLKPSSVSPQVFERRLLRRQRRSEDKILVDNSTSVTNHQPPRMSIGSRNLSKPRMDKRRKRSPEGRPSGTKGYAFNSPWNGTCEFSSGVTGHALKCKHTAPEQGSQAVTVSELRFNLPTSNGLAKASPNVLRSPDRPRSSKRSSYFSSNRGSESTYSEISDNIRTSGEHESEQLDLSLGQERAGGGFGGKQAKLGKLIVEPEGLKMLDLVVAANMGLWWKAYERSA
ncbi:MAG: hypothetical protein Q9171_000068 [Xanthocarpia ochracea]